MNTALSLSLDALLDTNPGTLGNHPITFHLREGQDHDGEGADALIGED